jgi:hypothetical protein
MSSSVSNILRAPNSEVVEKYLKESLEELPWLIERKVISVVAGHFASLMRWPEQSNIFLLQSRLAMRDWVALRRKEGERDLPPLTVDSTAELLALTLQKMPRDILVPLDEDSEF